MSDTGDHQTDKGKKPDPRPENCRLRLHDEGKPYPRSSCFGCGWRAVGAANVRCKVEDEIGPGEVTPGSIPDPVEPRLLLTWRGKQITEQSPREELVAVIEELGRSHQQLQELRAKIAALLI